ncbi:MAG: purine and other phosphorylase-like protein, family 1 [Steroidobacteraceae bacterium]
MQPTIVQAANPIGIVAALAAEASALGRGTRLTRGSTDSAELASLPDGALLAVSGMGCEAAARGALALADAGCGALVSWGLAGGLDPALVPGTIVVPETVLFEGGPALGVSPGWREQVLHELASRIGIGIGSGAGSGTGGALLTSAHALVGAAEKQAAFRRTGAVAVDMETYAIAEVAARRGLPCLAVRVIVDAESDEVPGVLAESANARGRIAVGRLLAGIVSAPAMLLPLMRLAGRYRAARRSLQAIARSGALTRALR